MSDGGIHISLVKCPGCGASVELHSRKSKSVACSTCGALFDNKTKELLATLARPDDFPPRSFLRLGLIGTFDEKKYQIIGRICYSASIREWDYEDKQYYTEDWSWDEWTLVGDKGDYLYIAEDSEGYHLARNFVPTNPMIPGRGEDFISLHDGGKYRINEHSQARAKFFEGEFTWIPELDEEVRAAEYQALGSTYSVEYRIGEDGNPAEVEFFRSDEVSELYLLHAFDLKDELAKLEAREREQAEYSRIAKAFVAVAVLLVFLAIGTMMRSGKKVFMQSVPLSSLNEEEGVVFGPFNLTKVGTVHNLKLTASIPDNSEAWAAVELLEDEDQAVNEFEGDFWRESGYDSDGHWSESDLESSNHFRLEQAGSYFARVLGNPGTATGSVTVAVYEGITLSRFFMIAALVSAAYGWGIQYKRSLNPLWVVIGVLIGLFLLAKYVKENSEED